MLLTQRLHVGPLRRQIDEAIAQPIRVALWALGTPTLRLASVDARIPNLQVFGSSPRREEHPDINN